MVRPEGKPGALPVGGGGGLPGLDSAPPPRSPPGHLRLLPAGPAASPAPAPPPPLTSARGRGGGHDSAGVGAARGRRPSALPLFTGSGLRRDAGGTNGLHYPRGPAIVRRHQAAPVVLRPGGLPSLAPPSVLFLPASARSRLRAARARVCLGTGATGGHAPVCVCRGVGVHTCRLSEEPGGRVYGDSRLHHVLSPRFPPPGLQFWVRLPSS